MVPQFHRRIECAALGRCDAYRLDSGDDYAESALALRIGTFGVCAALTLAGCGDSDAGEGGSGTDQSSDGGASMESGSTFTTSTTTAATTATTAESTGAVDSDGGSSSSSGEVMSGSTTSTSSGSEGTTEESGGRTRPVCGDGTVEVPEECEPRDVGGGDCRSLGFHGGALVCDPDACVFDTSLCFSDECGDGVVGETELCEPGELQGETCQTLGYDGGALGCDPETCQLDDASCFNDSCGDGVAGVTEECDGRDLGGQSCDSLGEGPGGVLACNASCAFDTTGCPDCDLCDAGFCGPGGSCAKVVFVTSATYNGNLGGLAGADSECQALAASAGLNGTYLAWLADDSDSPATRFAQATEPYVRTDGMQIASNWLTLIDGNLDAPLDLAEDGISGPPTGQQACPGQIANVWTNVQSDGTVAFPGPAGSCGGWTSTLDTGWVGHAVEWFSEGWTLSCTMVPCQFPKALYCFEQ